MALTRVNGNLITSGTITGNLFLNNTITGNLIAPAAITGDKIGLTAITSNLIATGVTITSPVIASANLTTALTLNGAAGTNGQVLTSAGSGLPSWTTIASTPTIVRSATTANTTLAAANASTLIDVTSGTITLAFTAAATLGSGWFCYIRNSGTGYITLDPNASELIDGLSSFTMYPAETRLVQCTGTAFTSIVITSFYLTLTTTLNSFIVPPGYSQLNVQLHGGGAGGNGGRGNTVSTEREGGGGGGAGALNLFPVRGVAGGTSIIVTIGAGGTGGTGGSSALGGAATVGGTTSFGSYGSAYGGGRSTSWSDGGGGGGIHGAGGTDGGPPFLVIATADPLLYVLGKSGFGFATGFGGGPQNMNRTGYTQTGGAGFSRVGASEYGGSGGGLGSPYAGQTPYGGASSIFGATGGGGGGGIDTAGTEFSGNRGGGLMPTGAPTQAYEYQGTGATGGTAGVAGTAGSVLSSPYGSGGGGGGGGRGAVGGAGATPGGGGGGGGGATTTGAAGGAGGGGQAIISGVI